MPYDIKASSKQEASDGEKPAVKEPKKRSKETTSMAAAGNTATKSSSVKSSASNKKETVKKPSTAKSTGTVIKPAAKTAGKTDGKATTAKKPATTKKAETKPKKPAAPTAAKTSVKAAAIAAAAKTLGSAAKKPVKQATKQPIDINKTELDAEKPILEQVSAENIAIEPFVQEEVIGSLDNDRYRSLEDKLLDAKFAAAMAERGLLEVENAPAKKANVASAQANSTTKAPNAVSQGENTQGAVQNTEGSIADNKAEASVAKASRKPSAVGSFLGKILHLFLQTGFARGVGNMFYMLGFYAECKILLVWRVLRDAGLFIAQLIGWLLGGLKNKFVSLAKGIWRDFMLPFVRIKENIHSSAAAGKGNAKESAAAAVRGKRGIKFYVHVLLTIFGYVMPLAAASALTFIVYSVVGQSYLLAVEVNGETVGYVSEVNELEDAKAVLRERIQLAAGEEKKDWTISPIFRIASSEKVTGKQQIVNNILTSYENVNADVAGALIEATGIYLGADEQLFAVTTEPDKVNAYLETRLQQYADENTPDAVISFVEPVRVGGRDGEMLEVFRKQNVLQYDELVDVLSSNVKEEVYYTVQKGDTIISIAEQNWITVDQLKARNPELAMEVEASEKGDDFEPAVGTELLIQRAQPFLQVQKTFRRTESEEVPYEVIEEPDPKKVKGARFTAQKGQNGVNLVDYDYSFVEGELVSRLPVEGSVREEVPVVNEIIMVGSYVPEASGSGTYSGVFIWPMPGDTGISRGISGHHRGVDITGAENTPIIASDGGVVVSAEYHWSWGYFVLIEHPNGMTTRYAHCTTLAVSVGDVVGQGQVVGYCGNTGNSAGNHLHFEVTLNGSLVDPMQYIAKPG